MHTSSPRYDRPSEASIIARTIAFEDNAASMPKAVVRTLAMLVLPCCRIAHAHENIR